MSENLLSNEELTAWVSFESMMVSERFWSQRNTHCTCYGSQNTTSIALKQSIQTKCRLMVAWDTGGNDT